MRVRRRSQGRGGASLGSRRTKLLKSIENIARGGFSVPDRIKSRLVPINGETNKKSLGIDTLYEQQSAAQSIPGDVACWGVFRRVVPGPQLLHTREFDDVHPLS
jgi:hypothetical protein